MMTELERSVLPFLKHVQAAEVEGAGPCPCPPESFAPCGHQYEGKYDPKCPRHRGDRVAEHFPPVCPKR